MPISFTLRPVIGIDLFAGAGGMSLGAVQSGVRVVAAVENDVWAAKTHAHNFPETHVICEDIRKVDDQSFNIGNRSESLIVFGGPPCRGFSTSNQKNRTSANPSNWLFEEYIRLVAALKPEWLVFENVKGILETERGIFLDHVLDRLGSLGYKLEWRVLNASDYGVPQKRARLFIVGALGLAPIAFPKPHRKRFTVKDAISDLPRLTPGANENELAYRGRARSSYAVSLRGNLKKTTNHLVTRNSKTVLKRYRHVPQGGNWEFIPESLMKTYADRSRCHTGIYYRLKEEEPSIVIGNYRKNMLIHPVENRGLSVREAARLQSFPDWFEFQGSIGFQQQQVGNAVPPLLAKALFERIVSTETKS